MPRLLILVLAALLAAPAAASAQSRPPSAAVADPLPRRAPYLRLVRVMSERHRLDPALVDAIIRTESSYRPDAVSPAGAVGLMQLMPQTARRYGVTNRFDPVQNVAGGTAYLADLLREFGPAGPEGVVAAIAAYNAGEEAVRRYGGIPPYAETRQFVARVILRYVGTGRLAGLGWLEVSAGTALAVQRSGWSGCLRRLLRRPWRGHNMA